MLTPIESKIPPINQNLKPSNSRTGFKQRFSKGVEGIGRWKAKEVGP